MAKTVSITEAGRKDLETTYRTSSRDCGENRSRTFLWRLKRKRRLQRCSW